MPHAAYNDDDETTNNVNKPLDACFIGESSPFGTTDGARPRKWLAQFFNSKEGVSGLTFSRAGASG
jgi:hypothetical protein